MTIQIGLQLVDAVADERPGMSICRWQQRRRRQTHRREIRHESMAEARVGQRQIRRLAAQHIARGADLDDGTQDRAATACNRPDEPPRAVLELPRGQRLPRFRQRLGRKPSMLHANVSSLTPDVVSWALWGLYRRRWYTMI